MAAGGDRPDEKKPAMLMATIRFPAGCVDMVEYCPECGGGGYGRAIKGCQH